MDLFRSGEITKDRDPSSMIKLINEQTKRITGFLEVAPGSESSQLCNYIISFSIERATKIGKILQMEKSDESIILQVEIFNLFKIKSWQENIFRVESSGQIISIKSDKITSFYCHLDFRERLWVFSFH